LEELLCPMERLLGTSGGQEDLLTRLDRLEKLLEKSEPLLEKSEQILELADRPTIKNGKKKQRLVEPPSRSW